MDNVNHNDGQMYWEWLVKNQPGLVASIKGMILMEKRGFAPNKMILQVEEFKKELKIETDPRTKLCLEFGIKVMPILIDFQIQNQKL